MGDETHADICFALRTQLQRRSDRRSSLVCSSTARRAAVSETSLQAGVASRLWIALRVGCTGESIVRADRDAVMVNDGPGRPWCMTFQLYTSQQILSPHRQRAPQPLSTIERTGTRVSLAAHGCQLTSLRRETSYRQPQCCPCHFPRCLRIMPASHSCGLTLTRGRRLLSSLRAVTAAACVLTIGGAEERKKRCFLRL